MAATTATAASPAMAEQSQKESEWYRLATEAVAKQLQVDPAAVPAPAQAQA